MNQVFDEAIQQYTALLESLNPQCINLGPYPLWYETAFDLLDSLRTFVEPMFDNPLEGESADCLAVFFQQAMVSFTSFMLTMSAGIHYYDVENAERNRE